MPLNSSSSPSPVPSPGRPASQGAPGRDAKTIERFWSKVNTTGDSEACWEWQASVNRKGYGEFWISGRTIRAHRFAWLITCGEIPEGMLVCHHCDNPRCVKPGHLFLGTHQDNRDDCIRKGRVRHPSFERRAKGTDFPHAKLSEAQVVEIRLLHQQGVSKHELSRRYGIDRKTIRLVIRREAWKHV